MGICHTCVGKLLLGPGARPAHRARARPARRDAPDLHQRARGRRRDRPLDTVRKSIRLNPKKEHECPPPRPSHPDATHRDSTSPRARSPPLTPEQIEQLGREFDAIHDEVYADLGDRDSRYIRSTIKLHRQLVLAARALLMGSQRRPLWLAGTAALSLAKILENMEIGHNVMHGQWDWMNDPDINSQNWDWDTASPADAWRHSHNYEHHTFTNIRGKDRDLGYEIMRIDPHQKWHPVYLFAAALQPAADGLLRVGRGRARPQPRRDPLRREVKGAGRRRAQGDRRQGARSDRQGLRRLPGARGARRVRLQPRLGERRARAPSSRR